MDIFKTYFSQFENAIVTLSGGADSASVLMLAVEYMGRENVLAATCVNPQFFQSEIFKAKELAEKLNVPHITYTTEMPRDFYRGGEEKCYHCKKSVMSELDTSGFSVVFDGTNIDDNSEERKGSKAIKELGIRSPLRELGLGKSFVYEKVAELDIIFRDESCKATRLTGEIDEIRMNAVEEFEDSLKEKFPGLRYRIDDTRIEFKKPLKLTEEDFAILTSAINRKD